MIRTLSAISLKPHNPEKRIFQTLHKLNCKLLFELFYSPLNFFEITGNSQSSQFILFLLVSKKSIALGNRYTHFLFIPAGI